MARDLTPRLRHAVRVLLLDEHDRFLLFRADDPDTEAAFRFPPRGGLEGDEDLRAAASREIEHEDLTAWRWWTLDELHGTADDPVPRALAAHLRGLLVDGPPARPVDVGV